MYNTIYPGYVRPYNIGINNRQIKKKDDEEKSSQSSQNAENNLAQERHQTQTPAYFPNGEKVAIDYTKKKINIEQVLTDFKNTSNAIGAPEDIKNEVTSYLNLIYSQSLKPNPNQQIIQSNLKNASQILDEYITTTLKKPSKVVENWVDALFLQHIDYKIKPKDKEPETNNLTEEVIDTGAEIPEIPEQPEATTQNTDIYIPEDTRLKRMFIEAKKYAAINNKAKALNAFQNTMDYAYSIGEEEAYAMSAYEKALILDDENNIKEALYNYNNAAKQSKNNNIKAKAHIKMGKIYDDYVKFEPAFNHYCAAVSFAGEADNLKLQTKALSDLAQIHAEKYDKQNAVKFMNLADTIAKETHNKKVIGIISSKNGKNCERLNENQTALKYYRNAAKSFHDIDDNINLAKKYSDAADIMLKYGNRSKAKKLLEKAFIVSSNTEDKELRLKITNKLAIL